jgi:hypothetical protein
MKFCPPPLEEKTFEEAAIDINIGGKYEPRI